MEKFIVQKDSGLSICHVLLNSGETPFIFTASEEPGGVPEYLCFLEYRKPERIWLVIPYERDSVWDMVLRLADIRTVMQRAGAACLVREKTDGTYAATSMQAAEIPEKLFPRQGLMLYCDHELEYLRSLTKTP